MTPIMARDPRGRLVARAWKGATPRGAEIYWLIIGVGPARPGDNSASEREAPSPPPSPRNVSEETIGRSK
jgi:hypothetical protein